MAFGSGRRGIPRRAVRVLLGLSLLAGWSACSSAAPQVRNPLAGVALAVVPGPASRAEAAYRAAGDTTDAQLVSRLADQPTGNWLTAGSAAEVRQKVRQITRSAGRRAPVLAVYDIPGRDCGGFSGGGAADAAAYQSWIGGVADGLGQSPAVVVLEPDAVPQTLAAGDCPALSGNGSGQTRYHLLAAAVAALTRDRQAHVYLDAGNAGWIQDLAGLATALRSAGIGHAAGFSLNVSNFLTTADSIRYGTSLSRELGGAHFVIDTSRNGAGPYSPPAGSDQTNWCNPPGRALGPDPTTKTGRSLVDAYLWVKIPGQSDGTCAGGPPAGQWWPSYALALVRDSGGAGG